MLLVRNNVSVPTLQPSLVSSYVNLNDRSSPRTPQFSVQKVKYSILSYASLEVKQTIIRRTAYSVWDNPRLCMCYSLRVSRQLS